MIIKLTKFQPARPYSNQQIYKFWRFCQPALLFHPVHSYSVGESMTFDIRDNISFSFSSGSEKLWWKLESIQILFYEAKVPTSDGNITI